MLEYWIAYLNVGEQEPYPAFECLPGPEAPVELLKEVVIVGNAETPDIYIHWSHWLMNGTRLHLVTCTEVELPACEIKALAMQAAKFAQEQCD
jgi:hypothetical protein